LLLVLDDAVWAGKHEGFMPVRVADQVGRCAVLAAHLNDLAQMVGIANVTTVDV
jgi:hypothetical protein